MASSAHKHHHPFPNLHGGATTAPPPTPSTNPTALLSTPDAADALSRLLHRLPPNLSLPTRRASSSSAAATCPPSITLSDGNILSSVSQLGFAQLTNHSITSKLANSAESEALQLFDLPRDQKEALFPKNWPFGYHQEEDDDDDNEDEEIRPKHNESFRLDSSFWSNSSSSSSQLALASLRELSVSLENMGLEIINMLMKDIGLENPIGDDPTRFCSVMWISESRPETKPEYSGGFYPYVVALQYQLRSEKFSLLSDSGWVSVLPHVDSILVTVGDIAQVWSNGKLKKVRGRPVATMGDENDSRSITMTLLITLPIDSTVAPILLKTISSSKSSKNNDQKKDEDEEEDDKENNINGDGEVDDERVFNTFEFEDYAWRVYHERLLFKDPLDRYRRIA